MDQQELLDAIAKRFAGKITCNKCGNTDWLLFLYVGDLPDGVVYAGCKKCTAANKFDAIET